ARTRRRRTFLPIAISAVSLLVLFGVGAFVLLSSSQHNTQSEANHSTKAPSTETHKPATPAMTKLTPADGSSIGSGPNKAAKAGELLDGIRQALFKAKQALAERRLGECRKELALADQLLAKQTLPETPRLQEEADDL